MNPMSEKEFQDYLRQANWQMRERIDQNLKDFKLDSFHRFDWDQWRGELVFSSGGTPKVVAKIQVAGNYSIKGGSWFWAWANGGLLDSVKRASLKPRQFGADNGITRLIQPKWAAKESDAWEMTAITHRLAEAKGAYKCAGPDGYTFMIFTDLREVTDRRRVFGAQTCTHVLNEGKPILLVSRELDGEVLALCGGENDTPDALKTVPLEKLFDLVGPVSRLADMPDGWAAMRESEHDDWVRSKAE